MNYISKNAMKNKSEMFVDLSDGDTKQVGYVITGKTEFARAIIPDTAHNILICG